MCDQIVSERVRKIVSTMMAVSPQSLALDAPLHQMPSWDSIQHLNLILALEEEFGLVFEPERLENFTTLTSIINMVKEKQG